MRKKRIPDKLKKRTEVKILERGKFCLVIFAIIPEETPRYTAKKTPIRGITKEKLYTNRGRKTALFIWLILDKKIRVGR